MSFYHSCLDCALINQFLLPVAGKYTFNSLHLLNFRLPLHSFTFVISLSLSDKLSGFISSMLCDWYLRVGVASPTPKAQPPQGLGYPFQSESSPLTSRLERPAGIALRFPWPYKPHHCIKVKIPSVRTEQSVILHNFHLYYLFIHSYIYFDKKVINLTKRII